MTLLVAVFAAIISTIIWYTNEERGTLKIGILCLMYWGASLMWFVDAVFAYAEEKENYFVPASVEMLNDFYLGISVVALGLMIWLAVLLIKDPKGVIKSMFIK